MLLNYGVGEDSWEFLDSKEINLVNPNGNQSWIFTGRTDAEAENSILWPPDVKNWLLGKDLMLGKIEGRRRRGRQMVGCHHWLNGHEFEQVPGVGDGQGGLACCSPWGCKELETTERMNWTELKTPLLKNILRSLKWGCIIQKVMSQSNSFTGTVFSLSETHKLMVQL